MRRLIVSLLLIFGVCCSANADIWMWTDAHGGIHFVNTTRAIFTWVDDSGKVNYSDKPEHESAVRVALIWHSVGDEPPVDEEELARQKNREEKENLYAHESAADRFEREQAESYYCKQAQQIYDSYRNAPTLYKTNENGEKEYLSSAEIEVTLAETKARVEELCI